MKDEEIFRAYRQIELQRQALDLLEAIDKKLGDWNKRLDELEE